MPSNKKNPFIKTTMREWKKRKRRELDDVLKSADRFSVGCALTTSTAYVKFKKAQKLLREAREEINEKNWGR